MDAIKAAMMAKLSKKTATYKENPYWGMKDGVLWDKTNNCPFDIKQFQSLSKIIIDYFRLNFDSFKCESQVLIVTKDEYEKFKNKSIPELRIPFESQFKILVLPQVNTWGNTSVSETYWQNEIVNAGITPFARIHSHHVLHAYQSLTDWSSLNSGTLEIVFGDIYNDTHEIAYWLDVRGTNIKDNVYRTTDNGNNIEKSISGYSSKAEKIEEDITYYHTEIELKPVKN